MVTYGDACFIMNYTPLYIPYLLTKGRQKYNFLKIELHDLHLNRGKLRNLNDFNSHYEREIEMPASLNHIKKDILGVPLLVEILCTIMLKKFETSSEINKLV